MNTSSAIPLTTITVIALWTGVLALLLSAWVVMMVGHLDIAVMLGLSSVELVGVAGIFSLRCCCNRTQALIRTLHGIEQRPPTPGPLSVL